MAKKDPETPFRRSRFRDYCRSRGWEKPGGGWFTGEVAAAIKKPINKASDLLNGQGSFGATIAREIEGALGLPAGHLDGHGEAEDFADVKMVDVNVAAGHGQIPFQEEGHVTLKFRRAFLRRCGVTEDNAVIVTVKGRSMEPTIPDGATLLVNKANREPRRDKCYVFWRPDHGLVVKRLIKDGEQWLARSDNDDRLSFPDFKFEDDSRLLGRAIWVGAML